MSVDWVPDRTGRFVQRPHYESSVLDQQCEALVTEFLNRKNTTVSYPVSTNDLGILIEEHVDSLDLYADLTDEGDGVEGLTDFHPGQRPIVRISRELTEQKWRENRLRTTLTHELGHVTVHGSLYGAVQESLFGSGDDHPPRSPRCKRDSILLARETDWMEWQAGYTSGAFLIPATALHDLVVQLLDELTVPCPFLISSDEGQELLRRVQRRFQVSKEAAQVRLRQKHYVTENRSSRFAL
jgi:IrrE N-terminal-like domain